MGKCRANSLAISWISMSIADILKWNSYEDVQIDRSEESIYDSIFR